MTEKAEKINDPENLSFVLTTFLLPISRLDKIIPHIKIQLLNKIKPSLLEHRETNSRIDHFIISNFPEQLTPRPVEPRPVEQPSEDTRRDFSSSTGLFVEVISPAYGYREITVNGKKVVFDDEYTGIHFAPGDRNYFDPSRITESLADGIRGIVELLDAIDQGAVRVVPVFIGSTNINMALIAQRLGFTIADECRTPDGKINRAFINFTVIGKLDDIRRKVEEFKKSKIYDRLLNRTERRKTPAAILRLRTSTG